MIDLNLFLSLQKSSCRGIVNATYEELGESIELGMMSASEFFDCGPEPPWLVDACEGDVVSPSSELEFSYPAASSAAAYHELNHHGNGAGPSNSDMQMDLEEQPRLNGPPFSFNRAQDFHLLRQGVHSDTQYSAVRLTPLSLEQHRTWLNTTAIPSAPIRVQTRRLAPAPAADSFFRACKKRKRSYL